MISLNGARLMKMQYMIRKRYWVPDKEVRRYYGSIKSEDEDVGCLFDEEEQSSEDEWL